MPHSGTDPESYITEYTLLYQENRRAPRTGARGQDLRRNRDVCVAPVGDTDGKRAENGSSQGQNLALTGAFVPFSLDSGPAVF